MGCGAVINTPSQYNTRYVPVVYLIIILQQELLLLCWHAVSLEERENWVWEIFLLAVK